MSLILLKKICVMVTFIFNKSYIKYDFMCYKDHWYIFWEIINMLLVFNETIGLPITIIK